MRIVTTLTDEKFLNLKAVSDPSNHVKRYLFAERLGVDSIAFIGYDSKKNRFLVNKEYKPPVDKFIDGAFGGSLDKDKDPREIVIDEVKEETGFVVSRDDVKCLGEVFVSTQMNQYCLLFLVDVTNCPREEREPENPIEAMAKTVWIAEDHIPLLHDWKAITIYTKAKEGRIL